MEEIKRFLSSDKNFVEVDGSFALIENKSWKKSIRIILNETFFDVPSIKKLLDLILNDEIFTKRNNLFLHFEEEKGFKNDFVFFFGNEDRSSLSYTPRFTIPLKQIDGEGYFNYFIRCDAHSLARLRVKYFPLSVSDISVFMGEIGMRVSGRREINSENCEIERISFIGEEYVIEEDSLDFIQMMIESSINENSISIKRNENFTLTLIHPEIKFSLDNISSLLEKHNFLSILSRRCKVMIEPLHYTTNIGKSTTFKEFCKIILNTKTVGV